MKRGQLAFAVLAVPVTALAVALSPSVSAATPAPTPVVTSPDPQCAFTNGCVSPTSSAASQGTAADPSPNAGVRGASVSTPATGGGLPGGILAIALIGLGIAAIVWVVRRR